MFTLVIVSMFKNESMILKEWIQHHLSCGVDHFYLIDNGSTDESCEILRPYVESGHVTLISDSRRFDRQVLNIKTWVDNTQLYELVPVENAHTQMYLINEHFLEEVRSNAKWVMVIDADEYVFSNILSLDTLVDTASGEVTDIWVPWRIFGSSHLTLQPPSIRDHFVWRMRDAMFKNIVQKHGRIRGHGKSLTRCSQLIQLGIHQCQVHRPVTLLPDRSVVHAKHGDVTWFNNWVPTENDLLYCNHYMVMSKEYFFDHKSKRQGGAGRPNNAASIHKYWKRNNVNDEHDTLIRQTRYKI